MNPSEIIATTERLQLRAFTLRDAAFIVRLVNTEGWLRFIGDRNVRTENQACTYLENGPIKSYRENGFGLWAVELIGSQQLVGMCGLLKRDYLSYPDLGFAFLPEFAGQGLAFEAANAVIVYAQHKFGFITLNAITNPDNARSIKLLEKLGFAVEKKIVVPPNGEVLSLLAIRKKYTPPTA